MQIKVCGMRDPQNIAQLGALPIHYMGLIFYPKSPRYAGDLEPEALTTLPSNIKRVGVFVNASLEEVYQRVKQYGLAYVQLHGQESVNYCMSIRRAYPAVKIIKVFSIAQTEDLAETETYNAACDYFLFDTKTPQYGGSGLKFNWDVLQAYTGSKPFFLSGGIGPEDTEAIRSLKHPMLYALDLNSKFELAPGVKDIDTLKQTLIITSTL